MSFWIPAFAGMTFLEVAFNLKKVTFPGLLKNAQMQVELCEIPFSGAPEILRSEVYLGVRGNDLPC